MKLSLYIHKISFRVLHILYAAVKPLKILLHAFFSKTEKEDVILGFLNYAIIKLAANYYSAN